MNKCTDNLLYPERLSTVRRYIIKIKCWTDAEKDGIKEPIAADIQRNESIELEMNSINNVLFDTFKHSGNEYMKPSKKKNRSN